MNFVREIEKGKISFKKIGVFKAVVIVLMFLVVQTLTFVAYAAIKSSFNISVYENLILDVVSKILAIAIIFKLFGERTSCEENNFKVKNKYLAIVFFMIIGFRFFYQYSIGSLTNNLEMNPVVKQAFEELAANPLIMMIFVCVVAPIFEEVIFRGIVLNGLSKNINPKLAVTISAFLFACIHGNLIQGINTFFLGIILGMIYIKTKSIYMSIFGHFVNNSFGVIISGYMENTIASNNYMLQIIITFVGLIMMIISYFYLKYYMSGDRI